MLRIKAFFLNQAGSLKKEKGFTLIELLIVIVVLGILMSMAVPALSGVKNKADTAVAKADLHNIMQCLEIYYLEQGEYPSQNTQADLSSISSDLDDLNIKNDADIYDYQTGSDDKKYILIYQAAADEYYYISTDESALVGPVNSAPTL
ncbi:MAG: type IV pilin protein [Halanaerobium sp.]